MKHFLLLTLTLLFIACSGSDDNISNVTSPENDLNIPEWLIGHYKADNLFPQFPYPKSHPYSLNFLANDIVVKGVLTSEAKSMQAFIDDLGDDLISIDETTTSDSYKIVVQYEPSNGSTSSDRFIYTIDPVEGVAGKINIEYYYVEGGAAYDYGTVRYTKQ